MAEPLEITITYGEKTHVIPVAAGDTDAATGAKEQVGFILDLFAGSADAKKRAAAKPALVPPTKVLGAAKEHQPEDDCEIHVGAEFVDDSFTDFSGVVIEPPNVCSPSRVA